MDLELSDTIMYNYIGVYGMKENQARWGSSVA